MEEAVGEKRSAGGIESQSELQEKKTKKKVSQVVIKANRY